MSHSPAGLTLPPSEDTQTIDINPFKQSFRRYAHFLRSLLLDALWRNKWLTLIVLGTGFLGVSFQAGVFGLIIYYAQRFSSGEKITIAGYILDPRTSLWLLGGGSVAVAVMLCLSVLCIYFSQRTILRMMRRYQEFCASRVFYLLGLGADFFPDPDEEERTGEAYLQNLVNRDSRYAGMMLVVLLSLIIPGITLIVATAVLFYLEITLTLFIGLFALVFLIYQYRVNKEIVGYSRLFEKMQPAASREYKTLIRHCKEQPIEDENRDMVARMYADGPVKKMLDGFEGRRRAVVNSRLVSGLFMGAVIGIIILTMGIGIIREGAGWGRLLVYVVALRFAMTNLETTFASITRVNRFYPQVRRLYLFFQSFEQQKGDLSLPLDEYDLIGPFQQNVVGQGSRIALVTDEELNRYTLAALTKSMLAQDDDAYKRALYSMRFATATHPCPNSSLREALSLPEESGWDDIPLPANIITRLKQHLPGEINKKISPSQWNKLDPVLKFILALVSALRSNCQWLIIEEKGFNLLDEDTRTFFRTELDSKITVFVFNKPFSRVGDYQEQCAAVIDESGIIGLGSVSWFASTRKKVEQYFKESKRIKKEAAQQDAQDIEDELDDDTTA